MAQKLEEMLNEVRYPDHIETDKNVQFNGTLTVVGATTQTGAFTADGGVITPSVTAASGLLTLAGSGTGTSAGGSVTINTQRGVITTESLTTGTLTVGFVDLKNSLITTSSQIFTSVYNGTNTAGIPVVTRVQVATAGSATLQFVNVDTTPLNGTLKLNYLILS